MNCEQFHEFIHAYLDGELDLKTSVEIEKHIAACGGCSAAYEKLRALETALKNDELRYEAPRAVRLQVMSALRKSEAKKEPWRFFSWNVVTAGALAAAAAFVLLLFMTDRMAPRGTNRLVQELTSSHIRSLMAMHIIDVASSDQHTVKPWFNGKLDFSPSVKDLAQEGFPLTGGRLDFIAKRPVAAAVFSRRKHVINLFMWPTTDQPEPEKIISNQNGYNLVHWVQGGLSFWAVSDLNKSELDEFAKDYQSANGG